MQTSEQQQTPKSFANLIELSHYFQDENICRKYVERIVWNGKPVCPHCGFSRVYTFPDGKRYKCAYNKCRKQFTVTVGTFFESSKVPLRKWLHALYIFCNHKKGISSYQLARDISVTQKTAWFILSRLRETLKEKAPQMLAGVFEVDETYVGGKEGNKHQAPASKAKRLAIAKEKKGYNHSPFDNKTCVFGMVQRDGMVRNWVIAKQQKFTLIHLINKNVLKGSVMYSDEFVGYRPLNNIGYKHEAVNHRTHHYARGTVHTANLDSYWSSLKRGIIGIYHHVSPKHLQRYCSEFSFRYNTRKYSETGRFEQALKQVVGRLKYDDLIAPPPDNKMMHFKA